MVIQGGRLGDGQGLPDLPPQQERERKHILEVGTAQTPDLEKLAIKREGIHICPGMVTVILSFKTFQVRSAFLYQQHFFSNLTMSLP